MPSRRSLLKGIGVGLAASATAGTAAGAGRSGARGNQPFHQQLHSVEQATKRFEDLDQALREGYQIMGPYVPGMGWHLVNPDYVKKAARHGPNLVEPPILTYNFDHELGAVEYAVPVPEGHADHDHHTYDLFNDEDSDDHPHHGPTEEEAWHIHGTAQHVFSNGDGELDEGAPSQEELLNPNNWVEFSDHNDMFPSPIPGLEAGDTVEADWDRDGSVEERVVDMVITHPSLTTLHVWVHYENPHGVFAGQNPAFGPLYDGEHGHEH